MREISIQDRTIAFLIFGFLLACYLFTYTGVIDSSDGLAMFATTESIVRRGEVDSNQLLWMGLQQGNLGPDGELYTRKGLGMVLLALPLVWLAKLWPALGLVQAALLLNPLLTAFTGALLYRTGRRLGWSQPTALAAALIFGLATLSWPYTQGFFSDPVCGWGLFAAQYGLLGHLQTGRKRYLLGGGAAWGLAYLARTINLITLPVFLFGLFLILRQRDQMRLQQAASELGGEETSRQGDKETGRRGGRDQANTQHATRNTQLYSNWRPLISFLIPIASAGLVSLWWNWARYGNLLVTGYAESEQFSANWLLGIYGLLIGPARGLVWYSPILLLALLGGRWFWRHARWLFGLALTIVVIYVLVYGKWYMWHGGYSWGPRFLVPTLPFLALLSGPGWEQLVQRRVWGWAGWIAAVGLSVLSVAVQWLGLLVSFSLAQDWLVQNIEPIFAPETFTRVSLSPLVLQWRYLTADHIHLAWWRGATIDWAALLTTVASALLGMILLTRNLRQKQTRVIGELPRTNWWYGAFLCVIALALLVRYQSTLNSPLQRARAERIGQLERPGDAILFLQPAQTQQFANVYHGKLPTYGLPPRGSLDADDEVWLERLAADYARLWVIPDATPPEESGWERALRMDDYLLQELRVTNESESRLALYASADAEPLVESGLGTVFGDPALANSGVDEANGWIRLSGYGLTTETTPGDAILLSLRWESLRRVDYNYHVFVHLLDAHGERVAQRDGQPVQWMRPISSWQPGEEIIDHYGLLLTDDLPTGEYTIAIGLYDPVSGQRLPISAGPGDFAIELGPILVESRS
jgi:hypothetical protein